MLETFHQETRQVLDLMPKEFTTHQFLKTYIMGYTNSYLLGLAKYHDVMILHQQIGKYLLNNAANLGISYLEDRMGDSIFGKSDNIAVWVKL